MNKTEKTKTTETKLTDISTDKPIIIGTTELSEIVSETVNRRIEPKRLRSILRNDSELSELFDDGNYTNYKFSYPSNITDKIINRFIEIEKTNTVKRNRSAERKTERKNKSLTVFDIDKNGKRISKRLRPDGTEIVPITKPESK